MKNHSGGFTRCLCLSVAALLCGAIAHGANQPLPEIKAWSTTLPQCPAYAKLFPPDYLAGEYTICENLPGMLMLHTNSGADERAALKGKASRLTLEIPAFLRLAGVCDYEVREGGFHPYDVAEEAIARDGQPYRRYTVDFDEKFSTYLNHWFKQQLCLVAEPDSRGKTGRLYWEVVIGGKRQAERGCDVRVLPPVPAPAQRTTRFNPQVWISTTTSSFTPEAHRMIDYWSGLSESFTVYDRRPRGAIDSGVYAELEKRADRTLFLMYHMAMIDLNLADSPQPFYRDVVNGKYKDQLPNEITRSGRQSTALPVWYMVEDPDGLWERYLTAGFTGIRENYPEVRALIWDFEFDTSAGYDPGNLERFGKYLELDRAATAAEASGKYADRFRTYMIDTCFKLVEKTTAKMREILPGVRWILCSDMPKHDRKNSILAECQLRADALVDGHMPMAYYTGRRFFDDIDRCTSTLKKEFIALNNPAERYNEWFDLYSPATLKQNILAAAALGCADFAFWPNDMLTGAYFHAVAEAFEDVARVEDFYTHGQRDDKALAVAPADQEVFAGGDTRISQPYSAVDIKSLVHKKDGEKLLTLFNYSAFPAIVAVTLPAPAGVAEAGGAVYTRQGKKILEKEFLAEIPAGGYKLLLVSPTEVDGETAPQENLERRIEARRRAFRDQDAFALLRGDEPSLRLQKSPFFRNPVVAMDNGTVSALLDIDDGGTIQGLEFIGKKQIFTGGCYLGRLYFINAAGLGRFNGFRFEGFDKNAAGEITARFAMTLPDAGHGETHALAGLEVGKAITLRKDNTLAFAYAFHNPTGRTMDVEFRLHNLPCGGSADITVDGKKMTNAKAPVLNQFVRPGANVSFLLAQVQPTAWSADPFTFDARREGVPYRWTFGGDGFAGVFFNNNASFTVEPLSGIFTLKPGESKTFTFTARPELR